MRARYTRSIAMGPCCSVEVNPPVSTLHNDRAMTPGDRAAMSKVQADVEWDKHIETIAETQYQEIRGLIEIARQKPHGRWFVVDIGDRKMCHQAAGRLAKEYQAMGYRFSRGAEAGFLGFTLFAPLTPTPQPSAPPLWLLDPSPYREP
jgi:hypothetical protein